MNPKAYLPQFATAGAARIDLYNPEHHTTQPGIVWSFPYKLVLFHLPIILDR